jgi:cold shock CspA family protein
MYIGKVTFFDDRRGFGFLTCDTDDWFFHASSLPGEGRKKSIAEGTAVYFERSKRNGRLCARNVVPITNAQDVETSKGGDLCGN